MNDRIANGCDMRSTVGMGGSDSNVSQGEGGKMYEMYGRNGNGNGSHMG